MTVNIDKKALSYTFGAAVVAAVLTSLIFCGFCCKNEGFGVVDLQRVVAASKDVVALRTNREAQINELKKMADEANAKIDEIKKDDEKKAATEKYLGEIQAKKNEFDNAYNTALQASDAKIQNIINSVAEKKDLGVVLSKTSVVSGGVDITEAVIDLVK
jgi:Skp family chaperone for outer membrane proteins